MGYTTDFSGKFTFTKEPTVAVIREIKKLEAADGREGKLKSSGAPDSYCQWVLTRDLDGIEWDGGEKFYNYVDWLQWIVSKILAPAGISLDGVVRYQGEEIGDSGSLKVDGSKVVVGSVNSAQEEELERLRSFWKYAESTGTGRLLIAAFKAKV